MPGDDDTTPGIFCKRNKEREIMKRIGSLRTLLTAALLLAGGWAIAAEGTPAAPEQITFSGNRKFAVCFREAVDQAPFTLDGFYWRKAGEPLWRYPAAVLDNEKINANLRRQGRRTSGGVIRFKTDSRYIALDSVSRKDLIKVIFYTLMLIQNPTFLCAWHTESTR